MSDAYLILAIVAAQRFTELCVARANTRRLLALGAVEAGARHYPLFVLMHTAWLGTLAVTVAPDTPIRTVPLTAVGVLMALRVWVMASLGPFWTTRIITLPGAPLVRRGPYRWFRHPNYMVVTGEIAILPLVFGACPVAVVFSVLNGALIAHRISVEEAALRGRPSDVASA